MRRLLARWIAVVALIGGVGVGATAIPASAATPTTTSTTSSTSTQAGPSRGVQPMDWWL